MTNLLRAQGTLLRQVTDLDQEKSPMMIPTDDSIEPVVSVDINRLKSMRRERERINSVIMSSRKNSIESPGLDRPLTKHVVDAKT